MDSNNKNKKITNMAINLYIIFESINKYFIILSNNNKYNKYIE